MTVKQWKQIISISIVVIIVILLALTIFFGTRYFHYSSLLNNGGIIDISQYDDIDEREATRLFNYFNTVNAEGTFDYQSKYSSLYIENDFDFVDKEGKVCYLTFDDGPNKDITPRILDILKEYNVKATFFVVYRDGSAERALYKRIVEEGHTIAVHTASHNYNNIYASVDAYLNDFEKISKQIEKTTGVKPSIFRFPGGSINTYNIEIYQELIPEMIRRGYVYYDWNVSSGDASASRVSVSKITNNVLNGCKKGSDDKIVLMHDGSGHGKTASALPDIIKGLQKQGYTFAALDNTVAPTMFGF